MNKYALQNLLMDANAEVRLAIEDLEDDEPSGAYAHAEIALGQLRRAIENWKAKART